MSNNSANNIRQRPNGTWEARFTADGKRFSVYGKTKREVVEKLNRRRAEVEFKLYQPSTGVPTFAEWLTTWLNTYCLSLKDSTRHKYQTDIRTHIAPAIGRIPLNKLDGAAIQSFYTREYKSGISPKSIRNFHGIVHKSLAQAVKLRLILTNPAEACDLPHVTHPEMHPIPSDKLNEFLTAIQSNRYADIYYVMLFTGLRRSELIGLTWDCVDFDKGTLRIYRQWSVNPDTHVYRFTSLKNNKERTFRPASSVLDTLRRVQRDQIARRLSAGQSWHNPNDFVFTNAVGAPLRSNAVYRAFKRIIIAIGLDPSIRLHDLRHTFATLSIQNGTDIKTISETLGHATTAFTMDVYGHVSDQMQRNASARMEQFIQSLS